MSYAEPIAKALKLKKAQVAGTIALLDDGNTLPFIARYRKEVTGELDEEQIRQIQTLLERLRALDERRATILNAIAEQEKLTPELEVKLQAANTITQLEDLYLPFKKKRHTRAEQARQRGLLPLAELIAAQGTHAAGLDALAADFLSEEVPDTDAAWAGARDIVAEMINEHPDIRGPLRAKALKWAMVQVTKIEDAADENNTFELYYKFEMQADRLRPHQVLAINRGEAEKILKVHVEIDRRDWLRAIAAYFLPRRDSTLFEQLDAAIHDAAQRLLLPAIERDVRRELTEKAEVHAIQIFAENLRGLLNQPPLAGHIIMGIDPAYRTGCKVCVIDETGKLIDTATVYPHVPKKQWPDALKRLSMMMHKHKVTLIAIGNGTASRETEKLAAELIQLVQRGHYLIINEAGASVYSASPLARAELPDLDVTLRGAVSIARRVHDPLAELVKIDPKSIGVGLYQHDVNQKALASSLDGVVESVVNQVGVDVNSASPALLTYVAGIGPKLADSIVAHRNENGPFDDRATLRKVKGLGNKSFEQAAGFLRIREGQNWLDSSAIHPESYGLARQVMERASIESDTPLADRESALAQLDIKQLARELDAGTPTLRDIFEQLVRPGRDPRTDLPTPILRSDVLKMEDLKVGMKLNGTVRNVVDFGAFVDIGVKKNGLLHRSEWDTNAQPTVGDVVEVLIVKLQIERGRIGLGLANAPNKPKKDTKNKKDKKDRKKRKKK